ncbi:MAG: zf-HC2 domain-containing protein, partial [Planctomycetota bacterium]
MACPDLEQLERFVRGELTDVSSRSVKAHVAACSRCSERVGELSENLEVCEKLRRVVPVRRVEPSAPDATETVPVPQVQ